MKATAPTTRWATIEATAAYASLSRATVYRLIDRSLIASSRVGTRRLVDLRSVDAHLEQCRTNRPVESAPDPAASTA